MHSNLKLITSVFLALFFGATLKAQTFSPHSQFGLGNLHSPIFSANKAMGGISAGYSGSREINYLNPASYAALRFTTFNIGLHLYENVVSSDSARISASTNGGLNHLALGFPVIMNRWGMTFGLLPNSYKNYNYESIAQEEGTEFNFNNIGTGSTYNLFWGNGFEVKNFRFGVNASFLFGNLDESQQITFADSTGNVNTTKHNELGLRDFTANFGVQYRAKLSKLENQDKDKSPIYMTVGAYGAPPVRLKSAQSKYSNSSFTSALTGEQVAIDSVSGGIFDQRVQTNMPAYFGAGVTFGNELTWTAGLDFHYENWKSFNNPLNDLQLANAWQFKLGGDIKPNYKSTKYGAQVNYRLGMSAGKSYVTHQNNSVAEFGMTFGFGLPLGKVNNIGQLNKLNLTMEIGRRGVVSSTTFKENYYKVTLAYALSDRWFIKRKFD